MPAIKREDPPNRFLGLQFLPSTRLANLGPTAPARDPSPPGGDLEVLVDPGGEPCLEVECGDNRALLYVNKLCQGSKGPSIRLRGDWLTPNEFQFVSGRETAKDWKRSIRHRGKSLKTLMSKGVLQVHPPICDCPGCRISSPVNRGRLADKRHLGVTGRQAAGLLEPSSPEASGDATCAEGVVRDSPEKTVEEGAVPESGGGEISAEAPDAEKTSPRNGSDLGTCSDGDSETNGVDDKDSENVHSGSTDESATTTDPPNKAILAKVEGQAPVGAGAEGGILGKRSGSPTEDDVLCTEKRKKSPMEDEAATPPPREHEQPECGEGSESEAERRSSSPEALSPLSSPQPRAWPPTICFPTDTNHLERDLALPCPLTPYLLAPHLRSPFLGLPPLVTPIPAFPGVLHPAQAELLAWQQELLRRQARLELSAELIRQKDAEAMQRLTNPIASYPGLQPIGRGLAEQSELRRRVAELCRHSDQAKQNLQLSSPPSSTTPEAIDLSELACRARLNQPLGIKRETPSSPLTSAAAPPATSSPVGIQTSPGCKTTGEDLRGPPFLYGLPFSHPQFLPTAFRDAQNLTGSLQCLRLMGLMERPFSS
uniref:sterile alpha motif domain-containing protein 11-like isoform X2 n=1 Tax=Myxine glutinosa TaxID=7769 RepID=UPI00358EA016